MSRTPGQKSGLSFKRLQITLRPSSLDTGQYFQKDWPKVLFSKTSKVKNPKDGPFLRAQEDLEGLRSQENKNFQNAQIKL